jgi:YbbR domain-containing protein
MPFQDVEEVSSTEYSGPPGLLETWIRKIFIEDWALKLLALSITLILWLAVTGVNKPVTISSAVQLNFIRPDEMEISNDPPRTVDVLLTGRRSKLESIRQLDLVATVDLSDLREGERVLRLSSDRVQMALPDGVKIDAFQPSIVSVHLEPIIERQLEVEVKLDGHTETGYEVYSIQSVPARVRVQGPASRVNSLQKAPAETIPMAGKKEKFTITQVPIDLLDPKVDVIDSTIDVTVDIGERRKERTFSGILIIANQIEEPVPSEVTIFGPASVVSQLKPEDIKVVFPSDSAEPILSLPPEIANRVILRSIKSARFSYPG